MYFKLYKIKYLVFFFFHSRWCSVKWSPGYRDVQCEGVKVMHIPSILLCMCGLPSVNDLLKVLPADLPACDYSSRHNYSFLEVQFSWKWAFAHEQSRVQVPCSTCVIVTPVDSKRFGFSVKQPEDKAVSDLLFSWSHSSLQIGWSYPPEK